MRHAVPEGPLANEAAAKELDMCFMFCLSLGGAADSEKQRHHKERERGRWFAMLLSCEGKADGGSEWVVFRPWWRTWASPSCCGRVAWCSPLARTAPSPLSRPYETGPCRRLKRSAGHMTY